MRPRLYAFWHDLGELWGTETEPLRRGAVLPIGLVDRMAVIMAAFLNHCHGQTWIETHASGSSTMIHDIIKAGTGKSEIPLVLLGIPWAALRGPLRNHF